MKQIMIVKRKGHVEKYDEKKVYASCYFACKTVEMDNKKCESICDKIVEATTAWARKQDPLTSDMIFSFIGKELTKHDKDAAFMFSTHRDVN